MLVNIIKSTESFLSATVHRHRILPFTQNQSIPTITGHSLNLTFPEINDILLFTASEWFRTSAITDCSDSLTLSSDE